MCPKRLWSRRSKRYLRSVKIATKPHSVPKLYEIEGFRHVGSSKNFDRSGPPPRLTTLTPITVICHVKIASTIKCQRLWTVQPRAGEDRTRAARRKLRYCAVSVVGHVEVACAV